MVLCVCNQLNFQKYCTTSYDVARRILIIDWKDIWLKKSMGSTEVIKSAMQHHFTVLKSFRGRHWMVVFVLSLNRPFEIFPTEPFYSLLLGSLGCNLQLAWACSVPVGRRLSGRLATTLVATIKINIIIFHFFCSHFPFSLSRPFLGSKIYLAKVDGSAQKPRDTSSDPVGHF